MTHRILGQPPQLAPNSDELMSRYIFGSKKFNCQTKEVHWKHFEPLFNEISNKYEVSLMRLTSLTCKEKKKIGFDHVGKNRGQTPRGCLDFLPKHVLNLNLSIEPETESHERHANIVGWAREEDRLEQAKILAKSISDDKECLYKSYE